MAQPEYEVFKELGDIGIILRDKTGQYEEVAEVWQEYEGRRGRTRWLVYRYDLERKSIYRGKIIPYGFHKMEDLPHPIGGYEEWFSKYLPGIASAVGRSVGSLARDLTSADPERRFWAYYDIGNVEGFDNLDSYPLDLSEREFEERVG